jgi:ferric-dicitrate binding protein FerR (iron transport regulator)
MSDSTDPRLLFADYASGAISAEHLQALQAALREDSDLRREFIEYMNIDSALGDMAALSQVELAEFETADIGSGARATAVGDSHGKTVSENRTSQTHRIVAFLGSVAAGLLIGALVWFASPVKDEQASVATLVTAVDAVLSCDGQPQKAPELLPGEYRLERGLVHLQFADGVMVYVEAPARFEAISAGRVVLRSGRLSASVPPEGIGFTVETPEAEVVDFGTEFSLDVAGGSSEVHVFEGRVRVQARSLSGERTGDAVDLRTSQAVMIDNMSETPVEIELATNRFIRTFDESRRSYARIVKQLAPVAFYRMAIRDQGLTCVPPEYSGVVLTGSGNRPAHASGVFAGGSLRVRADSMGRGGRVGTSPSLRTGRFTLSAFVYLEASAPNGVVAKTLRADGGYFALGLDEMGLLQATVRTRDGDFRTVSGDTRIALHTWRHVVMAVDGQRLSLYEDGRLVASSPCSLIADSEADVLWFGTDAIGQNLWDGRIDEVVLFDRALGIVEVNNLYQAALEEIGKSE